MKAFYMGYSRCPSDKLKVLTNPGSLLDRILTRIIFTAFKIFPGLILSMFLMVLIVIFMDKFLNDQMTRIPTGILSNIFFWLFIIIAVIMSFMSLKPSI
jgi:hypothetical protein